MGPQVTVAAQQATSHTPPPPAVTRPGLLRESGAKLDSEEPTLNIHPHFSYICSGTKTLFSHHTRYFLEEARLGTILCFRYDSHRISGP